MNKINLKILAEHYLNRPGEVWECGVYRGDTAKILLETEATATQPQQVRLFDTFTGIPQSCEYDNYHKKGDFGDTDLKAIRRRFRKFPNLTIYQGYIPYTFERLENTEIRFAHIDVDVYQSVKDCLEFIYPKLTQDGIIVIDDYGVDTCLGAKKATDEYLSKQNGIGAYHFLQSKYGQGHIIKSYKDALFFVKNIEPREVK